MAEELDLAATIGTWVAASLALFAIVGVLGPFLIWRASKTERHQALDKLEKGEAQNGGYISKGIPVTKSIRLFRRVHVPLLQKAPELPSATLRWNMDASSVSQESASWVQFCLLLGGYGISSTLGDLLQIAGGRTWLPLHKNWILIIGIVGRYARCPDLGKNPVKLKGKVKSIQASPGRLFSRNRLFTLYGKQFLNQDWSRKYTNSSRMYDDDRHAFKPLHGIIGTIWLPQTLDDGSEPKVYYTQHLREQMGDVSTDVLTVGAMFWLSVGCLPALSGDVYCLGNVEYVHVEAEEPPGPRPSSTPGHQHMRAMSQDTTRLTHFETEESSSDDDSSVDHVRMPSHFVHSQVETLQKPSQRKIGVPRAFQFSTVSERVEELVSVANSLEGADHSTAYSLEEVELSEEATQVLTEAAGSTFHSIDSEFIRLGKDRALTDNSRTADSAPSFIRRSAGQTLASVLLSLPLSPDGYLMSADRSSLCRGMLSNAPSPSLTCSLVSSMMSGNSPFPPTSATSSLQQAMPYSTCASPLNPTVPGFAPSTTSKR
ncbi:hypothetical protein MFIFM68171_02786 [Madurella fahalii]|uniref:Uncharacterized protein n=1 Tax=Madurella fahalii TaxID=1157608 RepID=A0ABQ0G475_9PEZI